MDTNEEKFNIARQLHFSGRIEEAQKIYIKLLKIYKDNYTLYYLVGTTYLQLKKQDSAIKYFNLSLKYNSILSPSSCDATSIKYLELKLISKS